MLTLMKRERAPRYILLVIVNFALSVLVTRLYLFWMEYPIIGRGNWHLAHVLWGGLLLSLGSLFLLVYSNARNYYISAILVGLGMGLFFDEIGKFVTINNDYFWQAAAPLIYGILLLIFLFYVYLKRSKPKNATELFYTVLDDCKEILDDDFDPLEQKDVILKLKTIQKTATSPELKRFAKQLLRYIEPLQSRPKQLSWYYQFILSLRRTLKRLRSIHVWLFRTILVLLTIRSATAIWHLTLAWIYVVNWQDLRPWVLTQYEARVALVHRFDLEMLIAQTLAEGVVGILICIGLWKRFMRHGSGLRWLRVGLLFSLATVDLVSLYFQQFSHAMSLLLDIFIISFIDFYGRVYDEGKL